VGFWLLRAKNKIGSQKGEALGLNHPNALPLKHGFLVFDGNF